MVIAARGEGAQRLRLSVEPLTFVKPLMMQPTGGGREGVAGMPAAGAPSAGGR